MHDLKAVDPWTWDRTLARQGVSAPRRRSSARQWIGNKTSRRRLEPVGGSDLRSELTVENVFGPGYCAACNTPRSNRRHVPRVA